MTAQGVRRRLRVTGIVQGVGFRPFAHSLATELGLGGWIRNDDTGVVIEIQGEATSLATFERRLAAEAPPLAVIEALVGEARPFEHASERNSPVNGRFEILASTTSTGRRPATTLVSPDVATCDDCLRELADPEDRRFGYPFTNCTNCGPRYSIVTDIPYDRPNTTMASFELCEDCRSEYEDPTSRRFHAQPVCCAACGPHLSTGTAAVAAALRRGEIVAVKGLGGYHLVVVSSNADAVARLRRRKHRDDKPFALMVESVEAAGELCSVSEAEAELLQSAARPIVLLRQRPQAAVVEGVAPGRRELGIMLPYTPLHHLLLAEIGEPIVCTSANVSDEPIAYRDDDARTRLAAIADSFLANDRDIRIRVEDSVARVVGGSPYPIRRSRGYAPAPVRVPWRARRPILACGADLKNTIALARGEQVFLSHHIGDLGNARTHAAFVEAIGHLSRLFEIRPEVVAYDLHPDYHSRAFGADLVDLDHVEVQHHHAHVASCLADAGHPGPVIGVAFDGLGYGDDGTLWGGEFLEADFAGYRRRAWFAPLPMPGGDAATREPWRMAAVYLDAVGAGEADDLGVAERNERFPQVLAIARAGVSSPLTSSVGRLFDAVSSLLVGRDVVTFEGQAAVDLEHFVEPGEAGSYPARIVAAGDTHVVRGDDLFSAVVDDLRAGTARSAIAARFHRGLANTVVATCRIIREQTGLSTVALSGGVFSNVVLLSQVIDGLTACGFDVLRHRRVPCNDGGISLGQAAIAAARDR